MAISVKGEPQPSQYSRRFKWEAGTVGGIPFMDTPIRNNPDMLFLGNFKHTAPALCKKGPHTKVGPPGEMALQRWHKWLMISLEEIIFVAEFYSLWSAVHRPTKIIQCNAYIAWFPFCISEERLNSSRSRLAFPWTEPFDRLLPRKHGELQSLKSPSPTNSQQPRVVELKTKHSAGWFQPAASQVASAWFLNTVITIAHINDTVYCYGYIYNIVSVVITVRRYDITSKKHRWPVSTTVEEQPTKPAATCWLHSQSVTHKWRICQEPQAVSSRTGWLFSIINHHWPVWFYIY